jgi:chromosome partitioning protein
MIHDNMKTYTLANLKGGSGKTTSAVSLAEALMRRGESVLVVDLDPQGALSRWVANRSGSSTSLLSGNFSEISIDHVETGEDASGTFGVITSDRSLAEMDAVRAAKIAKRLERLWEASSGYNYGLIDPPPSVGALVLGALMASDGALAPVEAGPGAIDGLKDTIQLVSRTGVAQLCGAFACRVDVRTSLDTQVPNGLVDELGAVENGGGGFKTYIREAVAMREAQAAGELPGVYDPEMTAVADYSDLATELTNLNK